MEILAAFERRLYSNGIISIDDSYVRKQQFRLILNVATMSIVARRLGKCAHSFMLQC